MYQKSGQSKISPVWLLNKESVRAKDNIIFPSVTFIIGDCIPKIIKYTEWFKLFKIIMFHARFVYYNYPGLVTGRTSTQIVCK